MQRALLLLSLVTLLPGGTVAERLDKEACDGLRAEQTRLVAAGARRDMEKGPEWARANLGKDRLEQVAKLMGVEEQIIFRCAALQPHPAKTDEANGTAHVKAKPSAPQAAGTDAGAESKARKRKGPVAELKGGQVEDGPKPVKKQSKPATEAREAGSSSSDGAEAAPKSKPNPKKAARAKSNADDAYVPPAKPEGDQP